MGTRKIIFFVFIIAVGCSPNFKSSYPERANQRKPANLDSKVEVIFRLEGNTVQGRPKVVSAKDSIWALFEKSGESVDLEKIAENTWQGYLRKGDTYVIGWIAKKLFGYCSQAFTATEGLEVSFSPGMPATFEYDLTNPPENTQVFPVNVFLLVKTIADGNNTFLSWGANKKIRKPSVVRIKGLAGGAYKISASTVSKIPGQETPVLYDARQITIKPGRINRFVPIYPQIDTFVEQGDVTIRGKVFGPDQKPLANKTVRLFPLDEKGSIFNLYYPAALTDEHGNFEFLGIRPNISVSVKSDNTSLFLGKKSSKENASISVSLTVGLRAMSAETGAPIQDILFLWQDGTIGKITDFKGKIVVLDFWASWCPPCIRAMQKLNTLASKFSAESDIQFIALSIDADQAAWKKTLDKSGWAAIRHGWFDRQKASFAVNKPVPYYMIIGKDGIIRSQGSDINIKLELDKINN